MMEEYLDVGIISTGESTRYIMLGVYSLNSFMMYFTHYNMLTKSESMEKVNSRLIKYRPII